eukprot:CAMPEP_0182826902 /NCGR_PEP_ID=MMETSP0006_2-20121128/16625_1 /TAXON_ID=97485 /ORGANISM="Prymnesium parvum, Strain Texoma1" /LENGTH=67 /DNA_ID=CAMNT_0024954105 /DNA_START=323 /DNA_END=526 /DNA_ORIENTATION=-
MGRRDRVAYEKVATRPQHLEPHQNSIQVPKHSLPHHIGAEHIHAGPSLPNFSLPQTQAEAANNRATT